MKAGTQAFRFRILIFLLLYVLGFLAPWDRLVHAGAGTLWLALSSTLARTGWIGLAPATLLVTLAALACLTAGASLRFWGTAYLGSATMRGAALQGAAVVAAGPYRYLRNPLYLGSLLGALGTSVLMPVAGSLFFMPAFTAFTLFLIFTEERFLAGTAGTAYQEYRGRVPRLLPRPTAVARGIPAEPNWVEALLAEGFPIAFAACFAILAWRYNAHVLLRCLIICYGGSLVARALIPGRTAQEAAQGKSTQPREPLPRQP